MTDVDALAEAFIARAARDAEVVLPGPKEMMLKDVFASVLREAGVGRSETARPLGASEVARLLLQRHASAGGLDHSSVRLTRNAKGDTQIEVTVRTGDSDDAATVDAAAAQARTVYETLRGFYPMAATDA